MTLKKWTTGLALAAATAVVGVPVASAAGQDVAGGWEEGSGYYTVQGQQVKGATTMAAAATPRHTGESETATISGTTNKRAKGWTTWVGKYHYTRAQMKSSAWFSDTVLTDSGRKWGTNGTSATSPWSAFNPNKSGTPGSAKTFYGS